MAEWHTLSLAIPGKDVFDGVRSVLETLLVYLDVLKALLDTIKVFLVDFGNPIRALVQALIKIIESLFNALKQTGLYGLYDIPNPLQDRDFQSHLGGYKAFAGRWKGSLYDARDYNRPQPVIGANQSGFLLFYMEDAGIGALIDRVQKLLAFFQAQSRPVRYPPPVSVKSFPIGAKADPILSVARVFSSKPTSIGLEWSLPGNQASPDAGFRGLLASTGREFVPPKFLIERSTTPGGKPVIVPVRIYLRRVNPYTGSEDFVYQDIAATEESGEPFRVFENMGTVEVGTNTATFLSGATGTYRYIDTDVKPDTTYYYRVRAFSGTLDLSGTFPPDPKPFPNAASTQQVITYPGKNLVMGLASPVVSARLPTVPADYDVVDTLVRFYNVCFALNFHRPLSADATFNADGSPSGGTTASQVGRGSIPSYQAALVRSEFNPYDKIIPTATGKTPLFPWEDPLVIRKCYVLANETAAAMLENTGAAEQFKSLMTGSLPAGPIGFSYGLLQGVTSVQELVARIPVSAEEAASFGITTQTVNETYARAFTDVKTRQNMLAVYNYIRALQYSGQNPNWVRVSILRDIVPWSGQILYEVMAKIQSLVDAYAGSIKEIKDFIDLLERKIDTLEQFVAFIVGLLDVIEGLEIDARLLFVDAGTGGIPAWTNALDTAEGDKPHAGPLDYTASVTVAYSAVDASAFVSAFKLLFGG